MAKDVNGKNGDSVLCCGPSAEETASVEAKPAACCSKEKDVRGCCSKAAIDTTPRCESCSATSSKKRDNIAIDFNVADININDWAGRYPYHMVLLYSLSKGAFKIFAMKM
jgi:hypothetical protein